MEISGFIPNHGREATPNNYASNLPPGHGATIHRKPTPAHRLSTPSRNLRDLAEKYGPLMHLRLGEVSTISLQKRLMKTHDVSFASRPQILAARILSYGFYNIALHRTVLLETTTKNLHTRAFKHKGAFNLTDPLGRRASLHEQPLVKKTRDHENSYIVAEEAGKSSGGFALADLYPSLERLRKQADRIIENIINEHQKDLETTKNVEGETVEDSCTCSH
ncbi:hypothetical protein DVH24_004017 [Malus domestica]|uniref:Uncharacterized protein n=1 Tax=Malus domestica TaxID=3750 RepID=A0A498KC36_MALDO|nr:hypothetical protein DVH24_004017 [Malus domestica]